MSDDKAILPSLPNYDPPGTVVTLPDPKQQAPLMRLMGKMLAKRLPRLMNNPKIHSQTVKLKHKKKVIYY